MKNTLKDFQVWILKKLSEDFENLLAALTKRIGNEEESLYEEYEALDRPEMF